MCRRLVAGSPGQRSGRGLAASVLGGVRLEACQPRASTAGQDRGAERGATLPGAAPPGDPDSQPVLEQQAREGNTEALAKEAQNPVANLISLPIQWNATPSSQWAPRAVDPGAEANRLVNVWNVQPVVPFRLNNDFFLITRTIIPVIQQPLAGSGDAIGIGDLNPTVYFGAPKPPAGSSSGSAPPW